MAEDPERVAKALKVLAFVEGRTNELRMVGKMATCGQLSPHVHGVGDHFWPLEELRFRQHAALDDLNVLLGMVDPGSEEA